jgi:Tir chaperone protein (CesT) family
MKLDDLMEEFRKQMELEALPRDPAGSYRLVLDDELVLRIFEDEDHDQLILLTDIGDLPPGEAGTECLRTLMRANYRWILSAGGSFGLQPGSDRIEFCIRESLDRLDAGRLEKLLTSVTAASLMLKRDLSTPAIFRPGSSIPASVAGTPAGLKA